MTDTLAEVGPEAVGLSRVKAWLTGYALPRVKLYRARAARATAVRALPGVLAMVGWSLAAGGIAGHFVHGIGPWVTLAAFSWFMTRLDSRI